MSSQPFFAARWETVFDRRLEKTFRRLGWRDSVIGYTGYGTTRRVRLMARVTLAPKHRPLAGALRDDNWRERRGWRNFWSISCVNRAARIQVGQAQVHVVTDRGGYIDVAISDHGLAPGWHHAVIETEDNRPTQARVLIVADDVRFGLISDIDDTIISSHMPRPLLVAWNSLVVTESARQPVPGMARCYQQILHDHPGTPVFYVSTGAWNTFPFLNRFMQHRGFPSGPMLLSDWGPTNTGWFRSGPTHKLRALRTLARDFPNIQWLLVGDDGQHDAAIYSQFAREFPGAVRAIALRELNPVQQVLAHGSWYERPAAPASGPGPLPPIVRGPNGDELWAHLQPILDATS
ncbi:MAG: DUF2183 domain-containing protein [Propionibacteriaceae bacterium]|nr:DUF2183 domain-containing protein [Propionibacteriaceae bacterium]